MTDVEYEYIVTITSKIEFSELETDQIEKFILSLFNENSICKEKNEIIFYSDKGDHRFYYNNVNWKNFIESIWNITKRYVGIFMEETYYKGETSDYETFEIEYPNTKAILRKERLLNV